MTLILRDPPWPVEIRERPAELRGVTRAGGAASFDTRISRPRPRRTPDAWKELRP